MNNDPRANVFLSYSSEQHSMAETVGLALKGLHLKVFFDRDDLRPGLEFDSVIRRAIESSEMMVFLISPASVSPGAYTLTELKLAMKKWDHPQGRVLPVMAIPTPLVDVPPYLRAVTILTPEGNLAAEVAAVIEGWLDVDPAKGRQRSAKANAAGAADNLSLSKVDDLYLWVISAEGRDGMYDVDIKNSFTGNPNADLLLYDIQERVRESYIAAIQEASQEAAQSNDLLLESHIIRLIKAGFIEETVSAYNERYFKITDKGVLYLVDIGLT